MFKNLSTLLFVGVVVIMLFNFLSKNVASSSSNIEYSEFISLLNQNQISKVVLDENRISGTLSSGKSFETYNPGDLGLMGDLLSSGAVIESVPPSKPSLLMQIFISWFPMLLLIGVWIFFSKGISKSMGGSNPFSFGKSKAKMLNKEEITITFADVAGADEAKEEVNEFVDFLKEPQRYQKLGAKIPRGILMVGPPGTGKTLIAKAMAGEAKVPFFSISGSDFVEMFVGVGASRVRDMFAQAKSHSPCIIFIDEIDAVGRSRQSGFSGGNDEREQTLNQLLVEMDGFASNDGVIVVAATNRPDVLDNALLRPGRFDRQVSVSLPDIKGRSAILKVHLKKVACSTDLKPDLIARGTPGFSGADLANIVNEAAIMATRAVSATVNQKFLEKAKDKIIMGMEKRSMVMSDAEKKLTAYHEAGHAIVGYLVPQHDPVYKVSIMPRGRALGVTMYLPESDHYSVSKEKLNSQLSTLYGGRVAEELIFGKDQITTGASNDIERATKIARSMVTKWGLSSLGAILLDEEEESQSYFGKQNNNSEITSSKIDEEVRKILDANYKRSVDILKTHLKKLHIMTEALLEFETIDANQVKNIMEGKPAGKPADWEDDTKSKDTATESQPESPAEGTPKIDDTPTATKTDKNTKPRATKTDLV